MPWTLQSVYLTCAAVGGAILVFQTVMLMFGHDDGDGGEHPDHVEIGQAGADEVHAPDAGISLLSVRTVAAFLAFFGLTGWGGTRAGWDTVPTLAAATGAGVVMLLAVAWLFSLQRKLTAQGNLEPARAVGMTARVYLRIPAGNAGKGKIHVVVQGRTAEFAACTRADRELPTGSEVRVTRQITPDTFEVEPLA